MENSHVLAIKDQNEISYIPMDFDDKDHLERICHILADYIIDTYEPQFIHKIIFHDIEFFTKNQKREMVNIVKMKLEMDREFYTIRHRIIFENLISYFNKEHTIVLHGFAVFRLNEYISILENYILTQIDEYLIRQDYNEFLELIKYFVNLSTPKCNCVDTYYDGTDYHIYDENHMEITDLFSKDLLNQYPDMVISADDMFLSLLISIAPKHIRMHNAEKMLNKELLGTIQKVFGARVEYL